MEIIYSRWPNYYFFAALYTSGFLSASSIKQSAVVGTITADCNRGDRGTSVSNDKKKSIGWEGLT